ncbi:hypothetical protein [Duganella sp. HH105]|nr:hypothetical protein [Duganella sp. HH105]OEZ62033.1 hypothetical protein DUGA6_17170 [Duganella sp. HH105]
MLLLISDANILIDMDVGGLLAPMFSMEYRFAVPEDFNDGGAGRVSAYA